MTTVESKLLCKDCKNSMVPLPERILSTLFFVKIPRYSYKCKLSYQEKTIDYDPVIGPKKIEAHYETCSVYRIRKSDCGPEGLRWTPKHKKDLFLAITRGKINE